MRNDIVTGICIGAAVCAVGIVYMPPMPLEPLAAATVCGVLGSLALLTAARRHSPAAVGMGMAGVVVLGMYALLAGVLSGPAALGVGLLAAVSGITLAARILREVSPAAPREMVETA